VVRFSGNWINTTPTFCGDGTIGRIFVDGVQVFQKTAFVNSVNYSVTVQANAGSLIDFVIDPGLAGNDFCDSTTFTATLDTAEHSSRLLADSIADWSCSGTQGEKNWFYGYYNRTADPGGVYQSTNFVAFPRDNGPPGPGNFWNGVDWNWYNGDPPWDEIGQ